MFSWRFSQMRPGATVTAGVRRGRMGHAPWRPSALGSGMPCRASVAPRGSGHTRNRLPNGRMGVEGMTRPAGSLDRGRPPVRHRHLQPPPRTAPQGAQDSPGAGHSSISRPLGQMSRLLARPRAWCERRVWVVEGLMVCVGGQPPSCGSKKNLYVRHQSVRCREFERRWCGPRRWRA